MTNPREFYAEQVNVLWPKPLPKLDSAEAISAAKRIYRRAMGKPFKGMFKAVAGNRRTWIRYSTMTVNAGKGWDDLVHMLSHCAHRRLHPGKAPHDLSHAKLERELIHYVIDSGWLGGKLKPKAKAAPDKRAVRYQQTLASIGRWDAKLRRAENALKKLVARKRYYEKTLTEENDK